MARFKNSTSVRVSGTSRVIRRAKQKGAEVEAAVQQVIRKYALRIERTAKKLAPVDTGRLRASIRTRLMKLAAEVLTDVEYAPFQELGTGRRGAASNVDPPTGYEYGSSRGISPNSFLRPAFERHRNAFVRELKATVRNVL